MALSQPVKSVSKAKVIPFPKVQVKVEPIAPPANSIDVNMLIFIERYAVSAIKWDILRLFGQQPHRALTATQIARMLHLNYRAVRPELGDLAALGVFQRVETSDKALVYSLTTSDKVLRRQTIRFGTALTRQP